MFRSELEQTIAEPAKKVGLVFDPPGLVQRILDEAGEDEGMLPLLQYALKETWALRKGNAMTADSYARSGGVREAIRITAERTFDALSPADKQAARRLFLRLVTPGEGQEDTRARAAMPVDEAQRKIVEQFAAQRARLLVTGFDRAARPTVEVAHEALIRTWPRLRQWIDSSREKLRSRAAILQAKAEWEQEGRREDLLLPAGFQLERARALLADPGDITTDDIKAFVSLSSAREEAALKQTANTQRKWARIRNIALVVVSMLAVFAGLLGWRAEQQRKLAEEQREQANDILDRATNIIAKQQTKMDNDTKKDAVALFQAGADHGNMLSMRNLGVSYQLGIGVAQDYAKAREWFEKAAGKGDGNSMGQLGLLYDNGQGVAQDYAKASEWFEKAAHKGAMFKLFMRYIISRSNVIGDYDNTEREYYESKTVDEVSTSMNYNVVGTLYIQGLGVAQDYAKAREWFEKAAGKGYANAMTRLGWLYANGEGVAQDYAKAREWFEKAAAKGSGNAMLKLGLLYDDGQGVAQNYAKARGWFEKAAENGEAIGMFFLGYYYAAGLSVAQDYTKAREWYEKAAAKDNLLAMTRLGVLYANGQGVAQDYAKASEWFEKAADKGDADAITNLGALYANGQGVAQDYATAREWYEKAAAKGDGNAMTNLGALYANGQGVAQDYATAREWFEKAAAKGEATAMFNLGALYANGQGVAQDYATAREWFEKAADKGAPDARTYLEKLLIQEAAEAGRYAEALQLQEALAVKVEEAETKREGKVAKGTAEALGGVAWYALFAREFTKALTVAERAHALLPDNLVIEGNRAHALMFLGRGKQSKALYIAHKGEPVSGQGGKLWERVIADDFAEFRKAGLMHPMMADIEKALGVSP